jgi:uncharacterized repeat protein (TIGR02543 family)
MMKKIIAMLGVALLALFVVACNGDTTTTTTTTSSQTTSVTTSATTGTTTSSNQQIVDDVYDWLSLGDITALDNNSPRLIMATIRNGVAISWVISHPANISASGVISQPDHLTGDVAVTLTATLTLGAITRTKVFNALVKALPAPQDAVPILFEDFKTYAAGSILTQAGKWGPVSGKTGTSQFFVVLPSVDLTIPEDSNALKVNAFTELQIEAALVHDLTLVIMEVDLYQTANGSPIYLQTSSSSPVIGFGLAGGGSASGSIYYRTDNGTEIKTTIPLNTWITVRLEVDLTAKTIEMFYYTEGNLIPVTPGKVTYNGTTALSSLFIRSGSSTTPQLNTNSSYVTNLVVNRIEALPRPVETVKLGDITGIDSLVTVQNGGVFSPSSAVVYNYYGSERQLELNTDYLLTIDNPVNTAIDGDYVVTYTFTNVNDSQDVKVIEQTVSVFSPLSPNVLGNVVSTPAHALTHLTSLTVEALRPEGILHYVITTESMTADQVLDDATKASVTLTSTTTVLSNLIVEPGKMVVLVIELNGFSNVVYHQVARQPLVLIDSNQAFYDMVHSSTSSQLGKYYLLTQDLDFTGWTWSTTATTKFSAVFDGGGFAIRNLNIAKTGYKGGIFADLENATIQNIIFENVHTTSDTSASALLAGEARGVVVLNNIVIMSSSNIVSNQYGALLIGRVRTGSASFENIAVYDAIVETKNNYGGGLVAGMDIGASVFFKDIYLDSFVVKEATDLAATGQMVGAIIGRVQGNATLENIVAIDLLVQGKKNVGGLIGKSDEPNVTVLIKNVYLQGQIAFIDGPNDNILVGSVVDHMPTVEGAFASGFDTISTAGLGVVEGNLVLFNTVTEEVWWQTNLNAIASSDLWTFIQGVPLLKNYRALFLPSHEVTLDYNFDFESQMILIKHGFAFDYDAPAHPGYVFVGWYLDAAFVTPMPEGTVVTENTTIYGKYDTAPASLVTFVTGVEGVSVDSQLVNYGQLISSPAVPQTLIGGILKRLSGWTLNGVAFDIATPITEAITLEGVWTTVILSVTFPTFVVDVPYGDLLSVPATIPTHPDFAVITFGAWTVGGVDYDFNTPVTVSLTFGIRWIVPEVIEITTLADFMKAATIESTYSFKLMNDLDFTGFAWIATGASFKGTFDGNHHIVKNLTFNATVGYGGIFARLNGGTIKNLILDNIQVTTLARAGILVGRIETTASTIQNIVVMNSSVSGSDSNGVGGLVGLVSIATAIDQITIVNTTVTAVAQKNVGGLIGRVDGATLTVSNIYLSGLTVTSTVATGADLAVGGLVGYVRDSATSIVTANQIIITDTTLDGIVAGAFIGYLRNPGTATVTNSYFHVIFGSTATRTGLIGRINNVADGVAQTTVFGTFENNLPYSTAQALTNNVTSVDEAWYATNLPSIAASEVWTYVIDQMVLAQYATLLPDVLTVTIHFNQGSTPVVIEIFEGDSFTYVPAVLPGFNFEGFYQDELYTISQSIPVVVNGALVLYGRYVVAPPSTVSFVSGVDGVTVTSQSINYGQTASLPVVSQTMIESVMKEVLSWTLNGLPFDFATPITGDIELVAVWTTVQYTVSFAGSTIQVPYGELATHPLVSPTHPALAAVTFGAWTVGGVDFDFNTPITANVTMAIRWNVPAIVEITTLAEFHYAATVETTYSYLLKNNLDFTGFAWTDTGASFKGTFDGGNFTISNISINATKGYGGIFARINNATVKNLVLDNITVQTTARAGALVGRIETGGSTIENIVLKNSSVNGADSNGVGGLVGQLSVSSTIRNVAVQNVTVTVTGVKNGGLLVGRVDGGTLTAEDIYIASSVLISTLTTGTDLGLGALVGYVRETAASIVTANRIVIVNVTINGLMGGALIGYIRNPGSASAQNVFVLVTFLNTTRSGLVGRINLPGDALVETTIFGSLTGAVANSATQPLANIAIPDSLLWWQTNLPAIANSPLWTISEAGVATLNIAN